MISFCSTTLPFLYPLLLFYPELTYAINHITAHILKSLIPHLHPQILETPFLFSNVYTLSFAGGSPTIGAQIFWGSLSLFGFLLTVVSKLSIPYKSIFLFLSLLLFSTSAISYLIPQSFPYTIGSFSEIVMKLNVLLWFVFPVLLSTLLIPFPITMPMKFLYIASMMTLILAVGTIKYAFSLYILMKGTFLLTPIVFFIFGPYMDLVYLVSFFALLTSRLNRCTY